MIKWVSLMLGGLLVAAAIVVLAAELFPAHGRRLWSALGLSDDQDSSD